MYASLNLQGSHILGWILFVEGRKRAPGGKARTNKVKNGQIEYSIFPAEPMPQPPDLPVPKPGDLPDYPIPKPGDLPDYPVPKPDEPAPQPPTSPNPTPPYNPPLAS